MNVWSERTVNICKVFLIYFLYSNIVTVTLSHCRPTWLRLQTRVCCWSVTNSASAQHWKYYLNRLMTCVKLIVKSKCRSNCFMHLNTQFVSSKERIILHLLCQFYVINLGRVCSKLMSCRICDRNTARGVLLLLCHQSHVLSVVFCTEISRCVSRFTKHWSACSFWVHTFAVGQ